jgi:hypothetical protein
MLGCFELIISSLEIAVLWDVTQCSMVDIYKSLGGNCCLHLHGMYVCV